MLEKRYQEKDAQDRLQTMQNRVRRLQFEDERASKMAEIAQTKAEKLLEARKRHYEVSIRCPYSYRNCFNGRTTGFKSSKNNRPNEKYLCRNAQTT
jgi:hypothetical protein